MILAIKTNRSIVKKPNKKHSEILISPKSTNKVKSKQNRIMSKKTLVLGATTNSSRYAYRATDDLLQNGHEVVPVGIKKGEIFGHEIINDKSIQPEIDTVTLYVGPQNQAEWYDYILETKPKRIIFNPGTENTELVKLAENQGIEVENACTLVMLSVGSY
ncbi:MAG: putative CoA-binding protein [Flammeovirgaceae bacterium]